MYQLIMNSNGVYVKRIFESHDNEIDSFLRKNGYKNENDEYEIHECNTYEDACELISVGGIPIK